jgi:hypothetical protein
MSNTFTLDSLREETEKKYAPVTIGLSDGSEVELKSLLRLGKKNRESVSETLTDLGTLLDGDGDLDGLSPEESELLVEAISKVINMIASAPAKLLKELDHPDSLIKVSLMTDVLLRWIGATKPGEALNSPA